MHHDKQTLRKISSQFRIPGRFLDAAPYGTGHINDTYATRWLADGHEELFIVQRINPNVFKQPEWLMENIERVTRHLQQKLAQLPGADPSREALTVIPTHQGTSSFRDESGHYWRTYVFIRQSRSYDTCINLNHAYESARMFGRFQLLLTDLPGPRLHDTIPHFHHTGRRLAALEQAIQNDPMNRAATSQKEIAFSLARRSIGDVITRLLESGSMPERITHNDTKINNVMIDETSGNGVCVIDLDTVMPGSVLYDFGDMVRSTTRTAVEDEQDLNKVTMDISIFDALARGYLDTAGAFLHPVEREHLAFSGILITFNIGIRFLTDYLMGDVYFKVHRPGHNLDRARVQFAMIEQMERQEKEITRVIARYA
ncbi:MAG: aminoglycoside phosphotransferase family protein [Lentisphaerae bacterium]|nr:aminoglycoside phosphotransferase family protein [Lentisphaerota bacterium]